MAETIVEEIEEDEAGVLENFTPEQMMAMGVATGVITGVITGFVVL